MRKRKKKALPVKQADLAAYAGVSASLISMTETGRHGERHLSAAASKRLTDLLKTHLDIQQSGIQGPTLIKLNEESQERCMTLLKDMLSDARRANYRAGIMSRKLDDLVEEERAYGYWLNTIDHLLTNLPESSTAHNDRVWLEYQQVITLEKLEKVGRDVQLKWEIRIEIEKARARVFNEIAMKIQQQ
jgi:transcriptional regulator with XRE-family HTH domain